MSNRTDTHSAVAPRQPMEEPDSVGGMPVEELIRIARETTSRIRNEDRKRLQTEATENRQSIQSGVPHLLQQFFIGKLDLDEELSRRFPSPPLLSSAVFDPPPGKRARRGFAQFKAQDESAAMTIDLQGIDGAFEADYVYGGMIAAHFTFGAIADSSRKRFLDLIRRHTGTSILWTAKRWERDYLIVSAHNGFARIYAFGANQINAACRLTPDLFKQLTHWLATFWITDTETTAGRSEVVSDPNSW